VAVARHIVQREVVTDPTFIRDVVLNAVSQYPVDQASTVRLTPGDLAVCRESLTNDVVAIAPNIQWMADATIQRGGCLTEGRERIIDGRVDTALERVYRSLGGIQS
jgi:flagellar biosynthesis/type III secretory pathway protein FliH